MVKKATLVEDPIGRVNPGAGCLRLCCGLFGCRSTEVLSPRNENLVDLAMLYGWLCSFVPV